jgi:hypothetical protein
MISPRRNTSLTIKATSNKSASLWISIKMKLHIFHYRRHTHYEKEDSGNHRVESTSSSPTLSPRIGCTSTVDEHCSDHQHDSDMHVSRRRCRRCRVPNTNDAGSHDATIFSPSSRKHTTRRFLETLDDISDEQLHEDPTLVQVLSIQDLIGMQRHHVSTGIDHHPADLHRFSHLHQCTSTHIKFE